MSERGAAVDARRVAGLLRSADPERHEAAFSRMSRLALEACAGEDPAEAARKCAALRDSVWQLAEEGAISAADARALCREIDAVQSLSLERYTELRRAFDALDRACKETTAAALPAIALEGALSADSAVLLIAEENGLAVRSAAGLQQNAAEVAAPSGAAARAARSGEWVEASEAEGERALLAVPLRAGEHTLGALRLASRSAHRFGEDEKRFLRAVASRAAALLSSDRLSDERLRQTLRTFQALVEASPLPILSLDASGIVLSWNRAAEKLFGWKREEVLGKPNPAVPQEFADEAQEIYAASARGEVIRSREVRRQRKDGGLLDLALSAAPLGQTGASIAILADISERKRRELDEAERARFRDHFIGIVGHDLRNPLTAIVTSAQLLLRYGGLGEKQAKVAGRIASSGERMARMIDDLLDFARSHLGGGFPIHPRRLDLRELCEHVVEELEFAYPQRTLQLSAEGDLWGSWDPDRMAQVISNLVGNALQHSPDDVPVTVRLRAEPEVVVVETHNMGPPIPREVLPHIFEPGRRGDARAAGLGLGLFIVQQIVLAHGGNIEAQSTPEEGTTFTVALPRKARQKV